jgi:curved DNA-binding protein
MPGIFGVPRDDGSNPLDYYEVLQINRNADMETVHRVYRFMATRFHPDNSKTGDLERFLLLRQAYQVLSDPEKRQQYDTATASADTEPLEIFELQEFIDGTEGEINRRLGVLSILYRRRRRNDGSPTMSLLDLEKRMSLPREYLDFTLWYLRAKGYVKAEDNSDYALTAAGVDYLESISPNNKIARELMWPQNGSMSSARPVPGQAVAACA